MSFVLETLMPKKYLPMFKTWTMGDNSTISCDIFKNGNNIIQSVRLCHYSDVFSLSCSVQNNFNKIFHVMFIRQTNI